ncbi:flavin reductase like domain-containing protein [Pseudoneurospora amorphoporcata]|uniref:Flavin reductase like domain-containing protein n=1 Tax=Pseudoneurospora amorphoporcata TaxID=241081 RepID=A0AAN6NJL9_9PEZI|nr:flavin reductase like domain-containing protein [Pseudoneurospora amorphoporcata]
MSGRRVLSCAAKQAHICNHNGICPVRSLKLSSSSIRPSIGTAAAATQWRVAAGQHSKTCQLSLRTIHTTPSHARSWTITEPKSPSPPHRPNHPPGHAHKKLSPIAERTRSLMRLFPHSVVVCTSTDTHTHTHSSQSHKPHKPTMRGMTMSSLTCLGLSPSPIVSFNITHPSRTLDALRASRRFNIHLLTDDIAGAAIADWMTRGNSEGPERVFKGLESECRCVVANHEDLDMRRDDGEAPLLDGDGVLYIMRCRVLEEPMEGFIPVRDHVIVLGEVEEIVEGLGVRRGTEEGEEVNSLDPVNLDNSEGRDIDPYQFGLVYADRRYRQLGNCIVPLHGPVRSTHEDEPVRKVSSRISTHSETTNS